jgi:hypothetical protein
MIKSELWIFVSLILFFHFLYLSLTVLLFCFKRFKDLAYGIIFGLILTSVFSGIIFKTNYEPGPRTIDFTTPEWKKMEAKPIPVVRSVYNGFRKDLSKKQVISLLGNSAKLTSEQLKYFSGDDLYYLTDAKDDAGDSYYLCISFFGGNEYIQSISLEILEYHE